MGKCGNRPHLCPDVLVIRYEEVAVCSFPLAVSNAFNDFHLLSALPTLPGAAESHVLLPKNQPTSAPMAPPVSLH